MIACYHISYNSFIFVCPTLKVYSKWNYFKWIHYHHVFTGKHLLPANNNILYPYFDIFPIIYSMLSLICSQVITISHPFFIITHTSNSHCWCACVDFLGQDIDLFITYASSSSLSQQKHIWYYLYLPLFFSRTITKIQIQLSFFSLLLIQLHNKLQEMRTLVFSLHMSYCTFIIYSISIVHFIQRFVCVCVLTTTTVFSSLHL